MIFRAYTLPVSFFSASITFNQKGNISFLNSKLIYFQPENQFGNLISVSSVGSYFQGFWRKDLGVGSSAVDLPQIEILNNEELLRRTDRD